MGNKLESDIAEIEAFIFWALKDHPELTEHPTFVSMRATVESMKAELQVLDETPEVE